MLRREKFYDINQRCIIAIDGTSASGKGTISEIIAERFSFTHCQSSIFYRTLAFKVINLGINYNDIDSIINLSKEPINVDPTLDIYSSLVTNLTSIISSIPEVRLNLQSIQKDFVLNNNRVVMEGRDIGTIIAPDADIKIYITADIEIRAKRRFDQIIRSGKEASFEEVLFALKERDYRDQNRSYAPLIAAEDAIIIDTTSITPEEVIEKIISNI